MQNNRTNIKQL